MCRQRSLEEERRLKTKQKKINETKVTGLVEFSPLGKITVGNV
jgi:hypothetical protein